MLATVTINYWHAVVAAIVAFVIGGLWYGPLFGKTWMKLSGITMQKSKSAKKKASKSMVIGFILTVVTAIALACLLAHTQAGTMAEALQVAFVLWLGFMMPVEAGSVIWEGKSFKLLALNSLHSLVSVFVMAAIIFAWV
jgi:hypothetical protein